MIQDAKRQREVNSGMKSREIATNLSFLLGVLLLLQACSPELVCRAQFNMISNECISRHFQEGQSVKPLRDYLQSAGFERVTSTSESFGQRDYYLREFDNEKGPRDIAIIVDHSNKIISKVKVAKWRGAGWPASGRERGHSPIEACIKNKAMCEEYTDE